MISPRTRRIVLLSIPMLAAGLFVLDWFTPLGLMDWVLYIIPLMLSFYANETFWAYPLAAVFSALTVAGIYLSPNTAFQQMEFHLRLADVFLSTGTLWTVAFMVAQHRRTVDETLKLACAVEHTPASITITDKAGNITYVNPKFTEVTGYAPCEVLGKNPRLLKSGETPPEEYARMWQTITAGEEWRGTFHNRKKNGELFWEAAAIGPVFNKTGQITHYLGVKEDITKQRWMMDTLRESELRYRSLFENMLEGFAYCQMVYADGQPVDFIYLAVNGAFEKITNLKEVVGKKVTEVIPGIKAAHPELFETYGRVAATGQPERFEIYLESLPKWLAISVYGAGKDCFAAAFEDITERKLTKRLLEFVAQEGWSGPQENFLPRLVEHVGRTLAVDYVFVGRLKDAQTVQIAGLYAKGKIAPGIEYATRSAPCRNVIGQTLCHYRENLQELFPDDPLLAEMGAQSYLGIPLADSAGQPLGLLAVLDTKPMPDTRLASALLKIAAMRAAGELEQQAAAATLQESENRYRQLVELSPDAVFIQCGGQIVFVNSAGLKLFGATQPEQIIHRPVMDFIHPKHREAVAARIATLREERTPSPVQEERYLRLDGSAVEVEVTAVPFTFQGRPAAQVIVRDITGRKKLESQMLRMQRMESVGTLAGGIAHDLNNVLAPLLLAVEMLKDRITDDEGQKLLDSWKINVQRAADLVKQVLTFGRGIQGERVPIAPGRLGREIEKMIHETFPKSIAFEHHAAPDLWTVTGDATQLHQVLLNLCINARDAMPNGGKLSLGLENAVFDEIYTSMNLEAKPGTYVVLKVVDTGTGIPPEIQDKIFEPFFTTKELGHGTGLGLSTTLGIVKSHGGFIHCYSETGKGSTFKVCLPANATPAAAENATVAQTGLPRGRGELVLVVDDEEPIRKVVQKILERFGYRVLLAANGAEALSLYARHQPEIAVVITDMMMPIMDGPAMIVALFSMNPKVKIIGSSGLAANGGVAKAINAGVKQFIPKPYTAEAMLLTLHQVCTETGPGSTQGLAGTGGGHQEPVI